MINELMQLAKSLPSNGVSMAEDKLVPLPKGKTFRVLLTVEGCISGVEVLDEKRSTILRKYMPNKFKSFPGFNQLLIPSCDVWQTRIEEVDKLLSESSQRQEVYKRLGVKDDLSKAKDELYGDKGFYKKAVKGIQNNLIKFPEELRKMMETALVKNETLARLLDALSRIEDEQVFLTNVEKICYERFKYDLFKPVSLFLDVDNYDEWPMAHSTSLA